MPVIALIVLLWQRRRVLSLFRRARSTWAGRSTTRATEDSSAAATIGRLGARAWRTFDTPQNAARAERLIARLRAAAARVDGERGPATV